MPAIMLLTRMPTNKTLMATRLLTNIASDGWPNPVSTDLCEDLLWYTISLVITGSSFVAAD